MRTLHVLAAALAAAIVAGALAVTLGVGSSHREAPLTSLDPTADDTDVYAFTAPDAPGSVTLISNWIPFEDPAGGPNFYRFDDRATYYLNIDNTGDGRYDVRYRFVFRTRVGNKNSYLYAVPPVRSIDDPNLNVKQTYSVTRERYKNGKLRSSRTLLRHVPVAPNNVGPKTFPNYGAVAAQAIKSLPSGGKVFAGQVDDPFFVDLGTTFDALNIRKGTGNAGGGKDDLAGYNVHTIALQVPEAQVTTDGEPVASATAGNAVVGVWSSTERPHVQVYGKSRGPSNRSGEVQVSRLGNPLVNEVVIPLGQKDHFNATQPANDAKNFGKFVVKPELAHLLNVLFPGVNVPEDNRTDIVQALLTGIPGLNQITTNPPPTDSLKINLGTPVNASPSRFGVLAKDTQGFPNGRRLTDDVVDIELRVVGGILVKNPLPLGDGVNRNDVPFRTTFPYLAPPHNGFDSQIKRQEGDTPAVPADPTGF